MHHAIQKIRDIEKILQKTPEKWWTLAALHTKIHSNYYVCESICDYLVAEGKLERDKDRKAYRWKMNGR